MKFSIVPVALLAAIATTGAIAQDSSVVSSTSASASSSSSASSASPASPASPASSSASSSASSGGSASGVCNPLGGDPRARPAGCPYTTTSLPPYNLSSLISYFIYGYTRGPEAKSPEEVANQMAGSVLQYYPTLTTPRSELSASFVEAISATIQAVADGKLTKADLHAPNAAVPEHLIQWGVAAAAIVAAGAIAL